MLEEAMPALIPNFGEVCEKTVEEITREINSKNLFFIIIVKRDLQPLQL
jgi:hypothetical protein